MDTIPDDIVRRISDDLLDIRAYALVCTRWHSLLQDHPDMRFWRLRDQALLTDRVSEVATQLGVNRLEKSRMFWLIKITMREKYSTRHINVHNYKEVVRFMLEFGGKDNVEAIFHHALASKCAKTAAYALKQYMRVYSGEAKSLLEDYVNIPKRCPEEWAYSMTQWLVDNYTGECICTDCENYHCYPAKV